MEYVGFSTIYCSQPKDVNEKVNRNELKSCVQLKGALKAKGIKKCIYIYIYVTSKKDTCVATKSFSSTVLLNDSFTVIMVEKDRD
jgi:hypothetical protein